ncbi:MAG: hypothetical protein LDL41_09345 [Coleofasciculus sp. S288]|nr:hypothetical protein [Coleofasciculus sp. S288]
MILCPILICSLFVIFCLSICVAVQDGITRLRRLHQVPCSRCAFFTGDYRLKCTVHPCKALSEEAIGCLDYEPIHSSPRSTCVCSQRFCSKNSVHRTSKYFTVNHQ